MQRALADPREVARRERQPMRPFKLLLLVVALLCGAVAAQGAPVSIACSGQAYGKPYQISLVYQGDAMGTLTVKDNLGEMTLPATWAQGKATDDPAETQMATSIRAFGGTSTTMPDEAAIEKCLASKLKPDELKDPDIIAVSIGSCAAAAPIGQTPVPIKVSVEIGIVSPPEAMVFLSRTYVEKSSVGNGTLRLDYLPPPRCQLAK
jgi:hypothetical protein